MKTSSPLPRASTPTSDQTLALLSLPISQLKRFASLTPDQQRALLLQSSLPPPPFPLPRSRPPSTKRLSAGTPSALPLPLKRSPSPLTSYTVPTSPASRHPRPNSLPLFDYRTSPQPPHLPHAHPIDPPTPDTTAWAATYSLQVSPTQPCDPLPEFKGIRQEDEAEEAVDDPPPSIITYVSRLSIDCSSSPTSPPHPYSPPSRSSPSPHSPPSHPPLLSPHNDNKFNLRLNLHPSPPSPTSSAPHPTPPLPFISQLKDRTRHRRGQPSYELTEGGTLLTGGYEINSKGVRRTPALRPSPPSAAPSPLAAPPDGSPIGSPSLSPSNGSVTLGVELRLTDLVRLSDLGAGASGTVVKALHVPSLTLVALKTVSVFDKADRHQLVKELNAFDRARGVGTSLLEFVGACFSEGSCVMALELMSRGSLEQAVQRWGAVRDERFLQGMLRQVLTGLRELASLHCVHRDIKLANLLINHHGCVKISDFGLLRQLSGTQDMCNTFLGTMAFLSPERMTGNAYTTKSDVWSVGVCVVYLVRGRLAMPTEYWSLLSVVNGAAPTLTPDDGASTLLCDFVQHMLRKDPTDRWSADQLLAHPFMTSELPEGDAADGGWPVMAEADVDEGELALIAEAVITAYHPGGWMGGEEGDARCVKIAEQLGCGVARVKEAFAERGRAVASGVGSSVSYVRGNMGEEEKEGGGGGGGGREEGGRRVTAMASTLGNALSMRERISARMREEAERAAYDEEEEEGEGRGAGRPLKGPVMKGMTVREPLAFLATLRGAWGGTQGQGEDQAEEEDSESSTISSSTSYAYPC